MSGSQAIEGVGVKRGTIFGVPPEMLKFDVAETHHLHESDRDRVEDIDEGMMDSIMALGVQEAIKVSVEGEGDKRKYLVVDGRRRTVHALEANRRLKKLGEPEIIVPVSVVKGDEAKLLEVMIALNEQRKDHGIMAKAEKALRMMDRVKDLNRVARAFGKEPQTITIWMKLASMSAYAKSCADQNVLPPSTIVKFADIPLGEQKAAIEAFIAEAEAEGVKPTAALAGAKNKGRRGSNGTAASVAPAKRLVKQILETKDYRDKLDANVVKGIRWMLGEIEATDIGYLGGIVEKINAERKEKLKAKASRAKDKEKRAAEKAAKAKEREEKKLAREQAKANAAAEKEAKRVQKQQAAEAKRAAAAEKAAEKEKAKALKALEKQAKKDAAKKAKAEKKASKPKKPRKS